MGNVESLQIKEIMLVVRCCNTNQMDQSTTEPFNDTCAAVITLMAVQPGALQVEQ